MELITAEDIANEWINAWNKHDLEMILSHYSDDIEFQSPFVVKLLGSESGIIQGKASLKEYFAKGLSAYPDLKFELLEVLAGVQSLVIYYRSVKELLAAEMMLLNSENKIEKVFAHYK